MDDRVRGLIPGVANREARMMLDGRVERLRAQLEAGDEPGLAQGLFEARLMGLWRAGRVTDFAALCQDLVGVEPPRARELAGQVEQALGFNDPDLSDAAIALWMRMESKLAQVMPDARVGIASVNGQPSLQLQLPLQHAGVAIETFGDVGRSLAGLRKLL